MDISINNAFIVIISLSMLTLVMGGIKILIHKLLSFDSQPFLWFQYSLFYFVTIGIYIFVAFVLKIQSFLLLGIPLIVIAEILIFYFRYYGLESKRIYAFFIFFSTIAIGMMLMVLPGFVIVVTLWTTIIPASIIFLVFIGVVVGILIYLSKKFQY